MSYFRYILALVFQMLFFLNAFFLFRPQIFIPFVSDSFVPLYFRIRWLEVWVQYVVYKKLVRFISLE